MQWSSDRNAGFSRANPQKLYLPPIIDPEYHFEAINVEAQQANPSSLLWWMKRLIGKRKEHRLFGRGSIEFISGELQKARMLRRCCWPTAVPILPGDVPITAEGFRAKLFLP